MNPNPEFKQTNDYELIKMIKTLFGLKDFFPYPIFLNNLTFPSKSKIRM